MAKRNRLKEYQERIHGIQALRRRAERLNSPYQGATGVKSQFYPHQLQTIKRILSDTEVRHLIADEVGLGKTIQALMIMNALRLQRGGKLRTTVLVPEEQQGRQWSDEVWGRAHTLPFTESGEPPGDDWVQVLWNAKVVKPHVQLAPDRFDLLIIDELQSIPKSTLRVIIRNAKSYQHLLLLTATPNLHSDVALFELMQLLEPDRISLCQEAGVVGSDQAEEQQTFEWGSESESTEVATLDDGQSGISDAEKTSILNKLQDFELGKRESIGEKVDVSSVPLSRLEPIFDRAWWFLRRIIRSRRLDYPKHLPKRKHRNRIIEPLHSESERLRVTSSFLRGFVERDGNESRAMRFARRAVVGGQALRERINEFQRADLDPNDELATARTYCETEYGNSRLDELIDFLNQQWQRDPYRKILIAASINPTIDYLAQRISELLPRIGPRGNRRDLEIMKFRWTRDGNEEDHDLIDAHIEGRENIAPFSTGDSQLAIAHASFRQNYNFQMADALVFYDLPWTPAHVDQWIGRVDRLGRETINPEQPHTPPIPVEIVTIGWRGEFDEQMVQVYESSQVFERPLQLDPTKNAQISEAIFSAGLGLDSSLWSELQTMFADETGSQDSISANQPSAFGTPMLAAQLHEALWNLPAAKPMIGHNEQLGRYVSSNAEDALSRWLMLLKIQGYYNFFLNKKEATEKKTRSLRFFTLSQSKAKSTGRLSRIDGHKPPQWVPFFFVRKHEQRPPRTEVELENDGEPIQRSLEFLDHGSVLHDELIETWIEIGHAKQSIHGENLHSFTVQFSEDHLRDDTKLEVGKRYLVAAGLFDPCEFIQPEIEAFEILQSLEPAKNTTQERMRKSEQEQLRLDVESEIRFIRIQFGSRVCFFGVKYEQGFPPLDDEISIELTTPFWGSRNPPLCFEPRLLQSEVEKFPALLDRLKIKLDAKARDENASRYELVEERIRDRKMQLEIETLDQIAAVSMKLKAVEQQIAEYREFGGARNEAAITTQFLPKVALFEEQISLIKRRLTIRQAVLDKCVSQIKTPSLEIYTALDIFVEFIFPSTESANACDQK